MLHRGMFSLAIVIAGLATAGAALPAAGAGRGAPAPVHHTSYAVVSKFGALKRGYAATGVNRVATGQFEVSFDGDVSTCVYVATIGRANVLGSPAERATFISVAPSSTSTNDVLVEVRNLRGMLKDAAFHLDVGC
jgi:hypothetical protein